MAITSTTIINGVSLGTTGLSTSNETKLTLQAATSGYIVEARLTSKAFVDRSKLIRVWFASSSYSAADGATGRATHLRCATYLDVIGSQAAGLSICVSDFELNAGGYLYAWVEYAGMPTGTTLSVIVNEI